MIYYAENAAVSVSHFRLIFAKLVSAVSHMPSHRNPLVSASNLKCREQVFLLRTLTNVLFFWTFANDKNNELIVIQHHKLLFIFNYMSVF